jgi:membrane-associated phospholipid phosphatase
MAKELGSTHFIYGVLIYIYVFKEKALAFHYTLIISAMMFFLCLMKMIIRYPRPYQYSAEIIPTSCSGQWGCPSGTTIRSTSLLVSLFFDLVHERRFSVTVPQYLFGLVLTIVASVSVMISRVYLAAHSINQTLFGAAIGIEIAYFMHFLVKP